MDTKHKLVDVYGLSKVKGDVGVEVEMEGSNLALGFEQLLSTKDKRWTMKNDGSLRGESCEWVLTRPLSHEDACDALDKLYYMVSNKKTKFTPSRRCGVHIHINVQDMTPKQIFNFICLYLMFENILIRWAGGEREGNFFCLRATDAQYLAAQLSDAWNTGNINHLSTNQLRYAAINVGSLFTYGSLEFRALPTPTMPARIKVWMRLLLAIKNSSLSFDTPRKIVSRYYEIGPEKFLFEIFGPLCPLHSVADRNHMMKQNCRIVKDIITTAPRQRGSIWNNFSWNTSPGSSPGTLYGGGDGGVPMDEGFDPMEDMSYDEF